MREGERRKTISSSHGQQNQTQPKPRLPESWGEDKDKVGEGPQDGTSAQIEAMGSRKEPKYPERVVSILRKVR